MGSAPAEQVWEEFLHLMLQGRQGQLFIPLEECDQQESHGDDFAVGELGSSFTSSRPIATRALSLARAIDHYKEDREGVLPGVLGDRVSEPAGRDACLGQAFSA